MAEPAIEIEFKVGDKVRCIRKSDGHEVGKVYEVLALMQDPDMLKVSSTIDDRGYYFVMKKKFVLSKPDWREIAKGLGVETCKLRQYKDQPLVFSVGDYRWVGHVQNDTFVSWYGGAKTPQCMPMIQVEDIPKLIAALKVIYEESK